MKKISLLVCISTSFSLIAADPDRIVEAPQGLMTHLFDEIQHQGHDPNATAIERANQGLAEIPTFSGSVWVKTLPGDGKWHARHAVYSGRKMLYLYKNLHQESLLAQLDTKRLAIEEHRDRNCPRSYTEDDPAIKAICIGQPTEGAVDFNRYNVDKHLQERFASRMKWEESNVGKNSAPVKGICIAALTDDEMMLWIRALTGTHTNQGIRRVRVQTRDEAAIAAQKAAEEALAAGPEQQQKQLKAMKEHIEFLKNWIKSLEATKQKTAEHKQYLREKIEQAEIFEYAILHPQSPVDPKFDVAGAEARLRVLYEQQRVAYQREAAIREINQIKQQAARALWAKQEQKIERDNVAAQQLPAEQQRLRALLLYGHQSNRINESLREISTMLSPEDLQINWSEQLGEGSFGRVFSGTLSKDNRNLEVAVKVPKSSLTGMSDSKRRSLLREVYTLSNCDHPNLVKFYGLTTQSNGLGIVTEKIAGENLETLLTKYRIPEKHALKILIGIASGMEYLHDVRGVKHRDLKPGNILIDQHTGLPKICDFGMSSAAVPSDSDPNMTAQPYYGTPIYAAPELMELNHTSAVDVFSFAYVMWQMWSRRSPFTMADGGVFDHFRKVSEDNLREKLDPACPWNALIEACWQTDPSKRPTFKEVRIRLQEMFEKLGGE